MAEEIGIQAMGVAFKSASVTIQMIMSAIELILSREERILRTEALRISNRERQMKADNTVVHGEQSIGDLNKNNTKLAEIDLKDMKYGLKNEDLSALKAQFKNLGVDFSVVRTGKNESMVYFKARDKNRIMKSFEVVSKNNEDRNTAEKNSIKDVTEAADKKQTRGKSEKVRDSKIKTKDIER